MTLEAQKTMHLMNLEIIPLADKREALLEILLSVRERTQTKSGCLRCSVYSTCGSRDAILYLEQWGSKSNLLQHIQSDLYRRILVAMELAGEAPEVRFYEVIESTGMELIKKLRALPGEENV